ncbi:SUMF1/EgtB/PvdO family nonheme iron enzyme [bacterium]|nr:SUMF1/EgtB/PvdO family nonheme iron enzyme [bacterium]MBR6462543.1 SUMF1/EgtB/PvdO family nonheme iron enzyme [bacterium]
MKLTTFIISIVVLLCTAMSLRAVEVPAGAVWSSDFELDNYNIADGKTLELLPTAALTYSAAWAEGENRRTTLLATSSDPYQIMTSGVEAEGSYVWDYQSVDPSVLPRGDTYTLSYTITSGGTIIGTEEAESKIRLLPEPALLFLLPLLLAVFCGRKMKLCVPALLLALISFEAAADVVSGISCRQRWPWNGKVDIDYTLTAQNASDGPVFSVSFYGKVGDNEPFALTKLEGEGQYGIVFSSGAKRITWDSAEQLGHTVDSSAVKVAIYAEDATDNATYIGFDLVNNTVGISPAAPDPKTDTDCKTKQIWFRRVEAGTFVMGSNSSDPYHEEYAATEAEHTVTITKPFYMGVFEMTQKQYETIYGSNPVEMPAFLGDAKPVDHVSYNDLRGENAGATWPQYTDHRVDATSFFGVFRARFGNCFMFDLPTDAQWEMACRDKGDNTYWGSGVWNDGSAILGPETPDEPRLVDENLEKLANYIGDSSVVPSEVGAKEPNAIGLYDMHGNVEEVCLDLYDTDISQYTLDPVGPPSNWSGMRVIRSGDCCSYSKDCRAAHRSCISPGNQMAEDGFRAVFNPFIR